MDSYRIEWSRTAGRDLRRLSPETVGRIVAAVDTLAENPMPRGARVVEGAVERVWRIRVGDHRVLYGIDDAQGLVHILYVRHRREAYRNL